MDRLFSDIKNTARSAVKKSGELLELTKLKMAAADTKSEVQTKFAELGKIVYEAKKNGGEHLDDMESVTQQIDELYEQLSEQEAKIVELKKQKLCTACGNACDTGAAYCSNCGAKFETEQEKKEEVPQDE